MVRTQLFGTVILYVVVLDGSYYEAQHYYIGIILFLLFGCFIRPPSATANYMCTYLNVIIIPCGRHTRHRNALVAVITRI